MTFQPGQSGNPLGNVYRQEFMRELRIALAKDYGKAKSKRKRLAAIADTLTLKACKGEAWAVLEIANRLDGKPLQQINASMNVDATSLFVQVLQRISNGEFRDNAENTKVIEHKSDGVD
jgi:hypothetical protein